MLAPFVFAVAIVIGAIPWTGAAGLADGPLARILAGEGLPGGARQTQMALNSALLALAIAAGKTLLALLSAYALAFFRFRLAPVLFGAILLTLLLPLEVRMAPTRDLAAAFGLADTPAGLAVPLLASAIGTAFFHRFFSSLPRDMIAAARLDGAGPWKLLVDFILPLSWPMITALFAVMFVEGWNQYLWPLLASDAAENFTLMRGIAALADGNAAAATGQLGALALLAVAPALAVVLLFHRWLLRGIAGIVHPKAR
jgi:sn-glycerol 3-phosphate transport system permease protein